MKRSKPCPPKDSSLTDLTRMSLAEARKGLRAKDFSAIELTEAYLGAINEANDKLNAYVAVTHDKAREMAKASDARIASGVVSVLINFPKAAWSSADDFGTKTQGLSSLDSTCN